ncbi:twin-arginine translocation signal domain-containing protein, partial [bacterium]|nr:twin-arginine translocation signal domain-containing protein [bacterium]
MNYHTNESRRRFLKTIGGSAVAGSALSACGDSKEEAVNQEAQDLHICMGLNTRPLTKDGKTYQPGECQCANIHSHACIGGNSCANLGACGTGTYDRQYWISENLC